MSSADNAGGSRWSGNPLWPTFNEAPARHRRAEHDNHSLVVVAVFFQQVGEAITIVPVSVVAG